MKTYIAAFNTPSGLRFLSFEAVSKAAATAHAIGCTGPASTQSDLLMAMFSYVYQHARSSLNPARFGVVTDNTSDLMSGEPVRMRLVEGCVVRT